MWNKEKYRLGLAVLLAIMYTGIVTRLNWSINPKFVNTLYEVLGIFFSIAISLNISLNYRDIMNLKIRNRIKYSLKEVKEDRFVDFIGSTIMVIVLNLFPEEALKVTGFWLKVVITIPLFTVAISLIGSIIGFNSLYKLNEEIEEEVMKEREKFRQYYSHT